MATGRYVSSNSFLPNTRETHHQTGSICFHLSSNRQRISDPPTLSRTIPLTSIQLPISQSNSFGISFTSSNYDRTTIAMGRSLNSQIGTALLVTQLAGQHMLQMLAEAYFIPSTNTLAIRDLPPAPTTTPAPQSPSQLLQQNPVSISFIITMASDILGTSPFPTRIG